VLLTWPLAARATRDVPGDLVDPLFTCWALGWNFHALGLSPGGWRPASYWDANIFFPVPGTFARSEHFLVQALQGAPVQVLTHDLVLTYNVLFLATFFLSATFFCLLAWEETQDRLAAFGGGLLYGFALFRWAEVPHLGALSSQWMPLALLLARRVAQAPGGGSGWAYVAALGAVTAVQSLSSGYYLLFFTPFLLLWAAVEAARAGGVRPWARLGAAFALAAALTLPVVRPYLALQESGARRDLEAVVAHSADLLSWVTAPDLLAGWGPLLPVFPRSEASLFPGLVTPGLALVAVLMAVRAAWKDAAGAIRASIPFRRPLRIMAMVLALAGALGLAAAAIGGVAMTLGPVHLRAMSAWRATVILILAGAAALGGWPRAWPALLVLLRRREAMSVALALAAAWLSLGPVVTWAGRPADVPSLYRWLYEHVPGFATGRAPVRFAMVAACFAALAAAWGLKHLRERAGGSRGPAILCVAFLVETAAVPLPLSQQGFFTGGPYQWEVQDLASLPAWHDGAPSPIVAAIRMLPDDAVLAYLPMGEIYHETRAMFDSTHHWRRMLNGYSSWIPPEYVDHAIALRDPLRDAPGVLASLRAAGATHAVVHEGAWGRGKGAQVTERLRDAGAVSLARAGDAVLLSVR
jgi:hypothetical protein